MSETQTISTKSVGILDPDGKNFNPLTNQPYSETYKNLARIWSKFPAYDNPREYIDMIKNNDVILVISGTGSGKTVLFPKYLLHALDYQGKIAITLPKRDIAESAAQFAADTLDVQIGEEVGYQFRDAGKNTFSSRTKLLYCTDGTLVARLLSDPELKEFNAVVIDEAHERKVNIDFLLFLLKNVLDQRPEFKLVIMSATINQLIFKKYYEKYRFIDLSIGTKPNYPIKSIFLKENLNISKNEYLDHGISLIKKLLNEDSKGGILFFVTSITETNEMCQKLVESDNSFKDTNICVPMFSGMNEEQKKIAMHKDYFRGFVKDGRKIIIATNVAESSLTVEGIESVIDSGLELRSRFDPKNRINILEKTLITHAQAKQRMGRTGRTGPGTCYHLYTQDTFENTMEKFPAPAIRTESISNEIVRLMGLKNGQTVKDLKLMLRGFIEPPDGDYLKYELKYLKDIGMITNDSETGELSKLGQFISEMQIEPNNGLALIMGYRLNCFREVASIIAVIDVIKGSIDKLFTLQVDEAMDESESESGDKNWLKNKMKTVKKDFIDQYGDHLAILKIFKEYEEKRKNTEELNAWTYKYFLKRDILEKSYQSYLKIKNRYRNQISNYVQMNFDKVDEEILNQGLKYKIMASFIYSLTQGDTNKLKHYVLVTNKDNNNQLESLDGKLTGIQFDPDSFINHDKIGSHELFYNQLFKNNKNPVKAKVITLISKKSLKIMKDCVKS